MSEAEGSDRYRRYRIPFEFTTAIKVRLSGLTRGSAGTGRARDTVNHLFVEEAFEEGRLSREAGTYLCDPNARPRFPSDEGKHDEPRDVSCKSCLDLMERWAVPAGDPTTYTCRVCHDQLATDADHGFVCLTCGEHRNARYVDTGIDRDE